MIRLILMALWLITLAAPPGYAADYCDRHTYGSPEWWNCVAQDRETGS